MRITFVVPDSPSLSRFFYSQGMATPPVGACRRAAAAIAGGAEVAIIDGTATSEPPEDTLERVLATSPEAIVIGTSEIHLWTFHGTAAYPYWIDFARRLRARVGDGVPILLDSSYAKHAWREVLHREMSVDAVLLSSAVDIVSAARSLREGLPPSHVTGIAMRGSTRHEAQIGRGKSPPPAPAYYLLRGWPTLYGLDRRLFLSPERDVLPVLPVLSMEGCPYSCSFCATPVHFDGRAVQRSPDAFVAEVAGLVESTGIHRFSVWDDTFTLGLPRMEAILDGLELRALEIEWWCFGRVEWVNQHPEVVARMARAGCKMMWLGVEATDERDLKGWRRPAALVDALAATRTLITEGVLPTTSYIVGNVEHNRDDVHRMLELSQATFDLGAINVYTLLSPMPGTAVHSHLQSQGLLSTEDLRLYNGTRAVIRYPNLGPDFVEEAFYEAYRRSILSPRFLDHHGRVGFARSEKRNDDFDWDSAFDIESRRMLTLEKQDFGAH